MTLTLDDGNASNFTFDFITQMEVIDCTPDFTWLDTANAT